MPRKRQQQKPVEDIKRTDIPGLTYFDKASHPLTRRVLQSLVKAEFPSDFDRFESWKEILQQTDAGQVVVKQWRIGVKLVTKVKKLSEHETPPTALFLPLLQAHLLKAKCAELRNEIHSAENSKAEERKSKLRDELNPLRRAELEDLIEKERAAAIVANQKRKEQLVGQLIQSLTKGRQSKFQDITPLRPKFRLWFDPMTVSDYVQATAVSRKTIETFLGIRKTQNDKRRSRAKPLNPDKKVNEPFNYGTETNLCVLRQWLCFWLKDVERCRTCVACTVAYCKARSPDRVNELLRALGPDFDQTLNRICQNSESFGKLVQEIEELVRYYAPPPQPVLDLDCLLSIGSLYDPLSVALTPPPSP